MVAPVRPLNVLFVVGSGRCGSTLLDILLGQIDGFFSTGELHSLWWAGILEGRRCGCGLAVRTARCGAESSPAARPTDRFAPMPVA
jgi:hypothetical protein